MEMPWGILGRLQSTPIHLAYYLLEKALFEGCRFATIAKCTVYFCVCEVHEFPTLPHTRTILVRRNCRNGYEWNQVT